MGQTLYLECNSGISGDMTVAALLDLGADQRVLEEVLESLPVQGFRIQVSRVKKAGLDVCDFDVKLDAEYGNHDHDMEYLYGHTGEHEHMHGCVHGEEHEHTDGHEHGNAGEHEHTDGHEHGNAGEHGCVHGEEHEHTDGHGHHHEHRGLPEIFSIIDAAAMTERAKETARRIFSVLADAEAKAHGVPAEQVHFHEVGAIDSIVDILSVAVCLDNLDVTEVIVPYLCEGKGTVRCQHGILPVPVPAVANIVQTYRIPVRITEARGELVTPTGAAVAAAVRTAGRLPEDFVIEGIGIGAGKRNYENPSLLRAMLLGTQDREARPERQEDCVYKLETNIDDCTGEALGHVMERLLEGGARDVHFVPVYMKKNRPAYELCVICDGERIQRMEEIIFRETTTIGIRRMRMERTVLQRESGTVMLPCGELQVKKCTLPDGGVRCYPEYGSVAALAREQGMSFWQVMDLFYHTGEACGGNEGSDAWL